MLHVTFNEPFFQRGKFPPTVFNGTSEIPVPNPWGLDSFSAPFDQREYKFKKRRNFQVFFSRLLTYYVRVYRILSHHERCCRWD